MKPPQNNEEELRVLLVDDIPENLKILDELLTRQGYETCCAQSGKQALQELEAQRVHLIVADAMMPGMDGFQLCKEIKRNQALAGIPFIIYTGAYIDSEDETFAQSIGVDRYVVKYDGLGVLTEAVDELLHRRYGYRGATRGTGQEKMLTFPGAGAYDDHAFLVRHHRMVVRKLEEQMGQLSTSELRYRNLFEHASVGIFVLDRASGRVLDVNRKGVDLLGFTKEELCAMTSLPFVEERGFVADQAFRKGSFAAEAEIRRKDGSSIDVELAAGPLLEEQDAHELVYLVDITEQKSLARQLLQADKMALMGRLAAGIAHDIRNPLAAISLNVQFVLKRMNAEAPERGPLEFALEGTQRIEKVIEHTLGLARITPPVVRPEQLNDIVTRSLQFLHRALEEKSLSVDLRLADDVPLVCIEAKQIEQVLLNIVQNAIDASPEQSVLSVSTCAIDGFTGERKLIGPQAAVVVIDRGGGIPQEQMKHLFEPFHSTKEGGTGLGLAISKQIMDKHGAVIRVEPALGGGTIVRLIFPAHSHDDGVAHGQG